MLVSRAADHNISTLILKLRQDGEAIDNPRCTQVVFLLQWGGILEGSLTISFILRHKVNALCNPEQCEHYTGCPMNKWVQ